MLHADGADHRRLRRLVSKAFTPARIEARIAFRTLLRRCADLAFAIDPADLEWRSAPQIRGLKHLPVTFTPA
jgi:cytochrome P450